MTTNSEKTLFLLIFVVSLLKFCNQSIVIPTDATCCLIEVKPIKLNDFVGNWYAHSQSFTKTREKCITMQMQKLSINTMTTSRTGIEVRYGTANHRRGKAALQGGKFTWDIGNRSETYMILGTDYCSFAVIVFCQRNFDGSYMPFIWIFTRLRYPEISSLDAAFDVMEKYNLNPKDLIKINQDCPDLPDILLEKETCIEQSFELEFDMKYFLGKWHTYAQNYTLDEEKCISMEFEKLNDTTILTQRTGYGLISGQRWHVTGTSSFIASGTFKWLVEKKSENYMILGTDNLCFVVIAACQRSFLQTLRPHFWILTRDRYPTTETIDAAYKIFTKHNLGTNELAVVNQNCSDIPTETEVSKIPCKNRKTTPPPEQSTPSHPNKTTTTIISPFTDSSKFETPCTEKLTPSHPNKTTITMISQVTDSCEFDEPTTRNISPEPSTSGVITPKTNITENPLSSTTTTTTTISLDNVTTPSSYQTGIMTTTISQHVIEESTTSQLESITTPNPFTVNKICFPLVTPNPLMTVPPTYKLCPNPDYNPQENISQEQNPQANNNLVNTLNGIHIDQLLSMFEIFFQLQILQGYYPQGHNTQGHNPTEHNQNGNRTPSQLNLLRALKREIQIPDPQDQNPQGNNHQGQNPQFYNPHATNIQGQNPQVYNPEATNIQGQNPQGLSQNGYPSPEYNPRGQNPLTYNPQATNIQRHSPQGPNQNGYPSAGYNQQKQSLQFYNPQATNIPAQNQHGYPTPGYNPQVKYPQIYNPQAGQNPQGDNRNGYSPPGYNPQGQSPQIYNPQATNIQGHNQYGYPSPGYNPQGQNPQTYNPQAVNIQEQNPQRHNQIGYPPPGYNQQEQNPQFNDPQTINIQGQNPQGDNQNGYPRKNPQIYNVQVNNFKSQKPPGNNNQYNKINGYHVNKVVSMFDSFSLHF